MSNESVRQHKLNITLVAMYKNFRLFLLNLSMTLIIAAIMVGCEKEYFLDPNPAGSMVVIEGIVTDLPGYQFVKITRNAGFYDTGQTPRITDATVTVTDNLGNITAFVHNPRNHPDSAGYYKPVAGFIGNVGRTYKVEVAADGKVFEGEDTLYPVTPIDSLEFNIAEDEYSDPEHPGRFYEVLIYTREPKETKDFYLFNFYRNDSLTVDNPTDIFYTDDVLLGESIDGFAAPIYFSSGDKATVQALSISRTAYVFYSDLYNLLNNDGGMYSPPPANCRNNLSNGALGFFQASAVSMMDISIE